jgi:hypothetical protein
MKKNSINRRKFIKTTAMSTVGITVLQNMNVYAPPLTSPSVTPAKNFVYQGKQGGPFGYNA